MGWFLPAVWKYQSQISLLHHYRCSPKRYPPVVWMSEREGEWGGETDEYRFQIPISILLQVCSYLCNIPFYKGIFLEHQGEGVVLFFPFVLSFHEILLKILLQVRVKLTEVNKIKSNHTRHTKGKITFISLCTIWFSWRYLRPSRICLV